MSTQPTDDAAAGDRTTGNAAADGGELRPLPYQWPGGPVLLAVFCAMAALLSLGGYARTHMLLKNNARQTTEALAEMGGAWRLELERLDSRLALIEERLVRLENRAPRLGSPVVPNAEPGDPSPDQLPKSVADLYKGLDEPGTLPPMPPKAATLSPRGEDGVAAEDWAEILSVNPGQKRVLVNRGRQDGLATGRQLAVYRGDAWIGDLRVGMVYDNMAACQIESSNRDMMTGDTVRLPAAP